MYVVIGGGGRLGRYIAKDLTMKGHEATVVELRAARCEQLVMDTGVLVIEGDACDVRYLEQAHTDRADVFIATTPEDDDNLVSCQLAKDYFGVKRTISRVKNPKNIRVFEQLGVDSVISSTARRGGNRCACRLVKAGGLETRSWPCVQLFMNQA